MLRLPLSVRRAIARGCNITIINYNAEVSLQHHLIESKTHGNKRLSSGTSGHLLSSSSETVRCKRPRIVHQVVEVITTVATLTLRYS
jgi:hypothetical protein